MRKAVAIRLLCCLAALGAACIAAAAQPDVSVAFYNAENFYDTIPSLSGNDLDYTPGGRMKWGAERYTNKLRNIARVLDEMAADIVGLAEVESEQAVCDLVMTLRTDYNYISTVREGITAGWTSRCFTRATGSCPNTQG